MIWKIPILVIVIVFAAGTTRDLHAQNDQSFVIGTGLGIHTFSETDDVRQSVFLVADDVAGMSQLYGEWYALDTLGFGLRIISLGITETLSGPGFTIETELTVQNSLVTIHWVPIGATDYTRMGLLGGGWKLLL